MVKESDGTASSVSEEQRPEYPLVLPEAQPAVEEWYVPETRDEVQVLVTDVVNDLSAQKEIFRAIPEVAPETTAVIEKVQAELSAKLADLAAGRISVAEVRANAAQLRAELQAAEVELEPVLAQIREERPNGLLERLAQMIALFPDIRVILQLEGVSTIETDLVMESAQESYNDALVHCVESADECSRLGMVIERLERLDAVIDYASAAVGKQANVERRIQGLTE